MCGLFKWQTETRTTMPTYDRGDFVKVEVPDKATGIGE